MLTRNQKYAVWGFLFGTIGLFILSALSLVSQVFELVSTPFMWPGRTLAALFAGPDGSDAEVLLLTMANGVIYALLFWLVGMAVEKGRAAKK